MKILELKINAWLRDHLIPRLAGIFRVKCSPSDVEFTLSRPSDSFFMSDLFFLSIRFPGQEKRLLVKLPPQDEMWANCQNYDQLFNNEIIFYQRLAKYEKGDYPEFYSGGEDSVFKNHMVLENVCNRGFFVSPEKLNVHLDYIFAGVRSLARFHGNTYAIKEQTPEKFQNILKDIINIRYSMDLPDEKYIQTLTERMQPLMQALRRRNYDRDFTEKIANLFQNCYVNVMFRCVEPIEPLATIVHGDCTINNILFRKLESSQGGGFKAMLIDFAMIMYTSPATDVSTFVYLCCSREDIKEYSEKLFRAYHDSLVEYMKERGIWDPIKYSYNAFWEDYKQRAFFGYVICAYFLPTMIQYEKTTDLYEISLFQQRYLTGSSETITNLLVDMMIDMREIGFLDSWIST